MIDASLRGLLGIRGLVDREVNQEVGQGNRVSRAASVRAWPSASAQCGRSSFSRKAAMLSRILLGGSPSGFGSRSSAMGAVGSKRMASVLASRMTM